MINSIKFVKKNEKKFYCLFIILNSILIKKQKLITYNRNKLNLKLFILKIINYIVYMTAAFQQYTQFEKRIEYILCIYRIYYICSIYSSIICIYVYSVISIFFFSLQTKK
jgi:hypothetical protein